MASGNQIKFGVSYQVDKASIQKVKKSLQDIQNVKPASFSGTRDELRQVKNTAQQVELALNKAFNVKLGSLNTTTFNNQLREAGLSVDKIYTSFSKMGTQGQVAFSQMASSVLTANLRLKETSNIVSKMGQTMANTAKWGIASSIMNSFTNEVRQAFQYVKSLDSALTDIRIVTGDSTQKMAQFAQQANKAAQSLGRSTMDYSKAALTFYQQGLSDQDVQARTQATLKAQNITGAGQEMADYLTAVWNGYKVANEEAQLYVDKLAAVADSSASNMAQLATAMSKVASTANMLGVPVDKLNAQIATITATTRQAPETVGNALKTIYARINDIATGADDAQISLGNYSSKMQAVGFSVLDASGHLRDTGDVIDEIGAKWNTLSREQQIYLARTMAGQRQYNNLLALFENWSRYSDLVTVSMNSQGATMEKNERYLDSLSAKLEQFGASQERVKSALIDENDLKGIVDFGTGFVNIFGSLIEGIGGGKNALLALGSIFTSVFSGTISKQINNFIVNIQNARSNAQALKNDIANLQTFKNFGAENQAVKQLTSHIGELQKYYSILDQATINNQKNLINQLDSLQNNRMQLQANKKAVVQYAESVHIANVEDIWEKDSVAVDELNSAIGKLQGSSSNLEQVFHSFLNGDTDVQKLTQHFNEFIEAYEQINPTKAQQLQQAFNISPQSGQFRQLLNQALDQANTKANLYSDTINNATLRQQDLNNNTQQLKSIITQNEKSFKQLFDVNSVVKFASGVGQIASVISTIVNLTKTWKDENVSLGEKLTRTFTTIGFMVPMLASAYKNISESLGLQLLKQTKVTLEIQKQLLLKRQIAIEEEKQAAKKLYREAIYGKNGVDWDKYNAASKMLKDLDNQSDQISKGLKGLQEEAGKIPSIFGQMKSKVGGALSSIVGFLSGPGGIAVAVGAVAVAVGVHLYKAWNKAEEAAKQATQQMKAAKDIYDQSKDKLDDLKSSLDSLKDAQNNLNELTSGTEEWKSALEDVNNQVIELLEKFPELAQYVSTNANGMLQISEAGQQQLLNQQKSATQANAMGYLSSRKVSDAANRQSQITQASRNMGLGAWNTSVLDNVVSAIQEYGTNILTNTDKLKQLTGASDKQIEAIDKHKNEIITLAEKITANTTATDSLTQSIISGTFIDPDKIAASSNADIFTAQATKAIANAGLDYSKYGGATVSNKINEYVNRGVGGYITEQQYKKANSKDIVDDIFFDSNAKQQLVERYKQINKDIADQISISGKGIVQRVDEEGKKTQISLRTMVDAIAAADATTAQGMEQIYKNAERIAQQYISKFGDDAGTIYKIGQGTQAAGQVSLEDLYNWRHDEDVIESLIEQTGKDRQVILQDIAKLSAETSKGLRDYISSLPEQIGDDLKALSDRNSNGMADISQSAQKAVGKSLQNAWKNGTYDEYLDVLQDLKPQDMEGFTSFVDSLGEQINSIDVSTFREKLKQLGVSTSDVSNQQIQELIDKFRELNGINLQENLGQLYEGTTSFLEKYAKDSNATLSKKQFDSLSQIATGLDMDLSQFFEQTWKGTYKLKTTTDEFVNSLNKLTLDGFNNQIDQTIEKLENLQSVSNFQESGGTFEAIQKLINNSGMAQTTEGGRTTTSGQAYGAAASLLSASGVAGIADNEYVQQILQGKEVTEDHINFLKENLPLIKSLWEGNKEEIGKTTSELELLKQQEQQAKEAQEEMNQKLREMRLDDSVDVDAWKDLTEYILETDNALLGISQDANQFEQIAEDLAEQILRFAAAAKQTAENFEDWEQVLNNNRESASAMAEVSNELSDVYSDLLNLPFENGLSADFTTDIGNLQLLKAAIQGDQDAYNSLMLAAQQDMQAKISLDNTDFWSGKNEVEAAMAQMNFQDIEIGANLDTGDFLNQLTNMVNAAGMSAEQATNYLASMGIDAEVEEQDNTAEETQQIAGYTAIPTIKPIKLKKPRKTEDGKNVYDEVIQEFATVRYEPQYTTVKGKKENKAFALKVKSAHKSSGGNFKYKQTQHNSPSTSGGGGGGGGGKGSEKKATEVKVKEDTIKSNAIDKIVNPYEQVQKSYNRQQKKLKTLGNLEKKLVGKDRLNNLTKQNKALQTQIKIIQDRQKISKNKNIEGSTANLRKQIGSKYFDQNDQLNQTAARNAAANKYNTEQQKWINWYDQKYKKYQNWINNVWNKYSGEQQQANKKQKENYDEWIKNKKTLAEQSIKTAKDEYDARIDLIQNYKDALEEDLKYHEQYLQYLRQIIEDKIAKAKIKVDLALDFGDLERDYLQFRNKVVRKIQKDDRLGNAQALKDQLKSYYNSNELKKLKSQITKTAGQIQNIQNGNYTGTYGLSASQYKKYINNDELKEEFKAIQESYLKQAKEDLENYVKQYMDSLQNIQELRDEIYETYLDSIDDVRDKMDDVIDQYETINDLVEHRIKLTQLLYGDNAGASIVDKYYKKQQQNNIAQMKALKQQADYWQKKMGKATVGSDAWKQYKKNYEDAIKSVNSLLENQLDLIATKFQNKVQIAIQNVTKKLTNGLGNEFLEQEWDYISKDDSAFLDVVNSKFGIEEVQRLYAQAIEDAGDSAEQQRKINNLMKEQLKILNEKDRLTQYDIDRAKASLEVEKARMALEDSRNQKTKMRLRRDSQGNYTYQYVQDEQKLTDLQSALADAQKQLYNMDKDHYKSQLNQMYDVYKDYLEQMAQLEAKFNATRDKEEQKMIQNQIDLLRSKYATYFNDTNEDLQYTLSQYLQSSYIDAMNIDLEKVGMPKVLDQMHKDLPYINSQMQELAENILTNNGQSKIATVATKEYYKQLQAAVKQAQKAQDEALEARGTSLKAISSGNDPAAVNILEDYISYYEEQQQAAKDTTLAVKELLNELDKFLEKKFSESDFVPTLEYAYQILQDINSLGGGKVTDVLDYRQSETYKKAQAKTLQTTFETASRDYTTAQRGAIDIANTVNKKIGTLSDAAVESYLTSLQNYVGQMEQTYKAMDQIKHTATDQQIQINANFPNVEKSTQIQKALESLMNRASQLASS